MLNILLKIVAGNNALYVTHGVQLLLMVYVVNDAHK